MNHFHLLRPSKSCLIVAGALCAHGEVFPATLVVAPSPKVAWSTLDGGGGTSRAGRFVLTGTIGQPDAAPVATGGRFRLAGGFWPALGAVQTPGAPFLNIERLQEGGLRLFWLRTTSQWILESTPTLGGLEPPAWNPVPFLPQSDATHEFVVIEAVADAAYFRLAQRVP